jgi:hypothetical protein
MRNRLLRKIAPLTLLFVLLLAQSAFADNDGRGFWGATNDKVVTNFGFAVIAFFPIFVFLMSMLQKRLDRRKEERHAAHESLGDARWRGGW